MTFVRFVGYRLELNNLLKYFDSPSFSECSEGKFSTPELKRFSKWAYQSSMEMLLVTVGFLLCFLIWFQKACGSLATLSGRPLYDFLLSFFLFFLTYLYSLLCALHRILSSSKPDVLKLESILLTSFVLLLVLVTLCVKASATFVTFSKLAFLAHTPANFKNAACKLP